MKNIDIKLEGIYKEDENIRKCREKAMLYLSYGDHTVKSMHEKLTAAGFDVVTVDEVLQYLVQRKYINEADYLERFIKNAAYKKKYGKKRIDLMLYSKGFSKAVINEVCENVFDDIDFAQICAERMSKTDLSLLTEKKSRDKLIASQVRSGFSLSDIKKAFEILKSRVN